MTKETDSSAADATSQSGQGDHANVDPSAEPVGGSANPFESEPSEGDSKETGKPADREAAPGEKGEQEGSELEKWKDLALRRQADFENYRKRVAREKAEAIAYANSSLLEQLLPFIDSFEMGLAAAEAESKDSVIYQGMAMVRRQLDSFLESQGVTRIDLAPGAPMPFDPSIHEAVGHESDPEVPEGHVLQVQRKGYRLRGRLLRPALVVVSSGPDTPAEGGQE